MLAGGNTGLGQGPGCEGDLRGNRGPFASAAIAVPQRRDTMWGGLSSSIGWNSALSRDVSQPMNFAND